MSVPISIKAGEFLFKNFYTIYRPLYFLYKKINEKSEIKIFKENIHSGNIVIDIGANIGFYSMLFAKLVGNNGKVIAFEPDKTNYSRLIKNIKGFNNIITENKAVSNQNGIIKLYKSELNVDHRTYPIENSSAYEEIECIKIDEYLLMKNIQKIDFIKMDIQGYEPIALQGMQNTLLHHPHLKLFSEYWPYGLKQAGYSCELYYQLLSQYFNTIYLIDKTNFISLDEKKLKSLIVSPNIYYNILAFNK